ncbi:MAG: IS200/IS605 family transposase [Balneolaceae bacterium]|nr:IS200/IS605 family transposase [Balneolaceae bacterium]
MANTYHKIYIQTVFPVKFRKALIQPEWKSELYAVIGNLINKTGCKTLIVNGTHDHVHCLFAQVPKLSVSDVMKTTKAKSSKWINQTGFLPHRFEWQPGFGCFSYSQSQLGNVYRYIRNQEEHHKKIDFLDEYKRLLKKFKIDFDERYLFQRLV